MSESVVKEVVYLGSSARGLSEIIKFDGFRIEAALCIADRATEELKFLAVENNIDLIFLSGCADLRQAISKFNSNTLFVIYQFDLLIPADLCEKFTFFNFHRGSLYFNRGATPDIRSILLGHTSTCMSLHKINEKIDAGVLISTFDISLTVDDDVASIRKRLESGFPPLLHHLIEFISGQRSGTIIESGDYYPWISESDFTIDIENDDFITVERKIRSQRMYNGAVLYVRGTKLYVDEIIHKSELVSTDRDPKLDPDHVSFNCKSHYLVLRRNREPKFEPPPVRPTSNRI